MSDPRVQARRPVHGLEPQPARAMSPRGIAIVVAIYVVLFGAAALHWWLAG